MPNYPIPSRLGALALTREERAIVKHARTQERRVIATRISDVGRRQVASGRMRDIADLTNDALEAGGEIGDRLAYEAQQRPFFARELAEIATRGARGLKTELGYYIDEGH